MGAMEGAFTGCNCFSFIISRLFAFGLPPSAYRLTTGRLFAFGFILQLTLLLKDGSTLQGIAKLRRLVL